MAITVSIEKLHPETIHVISAGIIELIKSDGDSTHIDLATKCIGKYGANISELKKMKFIKPYAVFNGELANPRVWTGYLGMSSRNDFLNNEEIQENCLIVGLRNLYEECVLNGAIQEDDSEKEAAGLLLVAKAAGAGSALKFREGIPIGPRPLVGVFQLTSSEDVTKELIPWFQKGYGAPDQAGTIGQLGKSPLFFDTYINSTASAKFESSTIQSKKFSINNSLPPIEREELARIYLTEQRQKRTSAIKKYKIDTGLTGTDLIRNFYDQVRLGKITY